MAWVTADGAVSEQDLRHWLDDRLPAYMRPDRILQLSAMPLNANGKVDLAALPEPSVAFAAVRSEPQGELEIRLAAIWRELLGIEEVGRDDDFFDLGGNSLIGLRMFARIGREFGASLPLSTLLRAKNVRALAAIIGTGPDQKGSHPAHLATIQPLGHQPPIFAIHGGDGGVIFYRELAERLSTDRPFHAIESPHLGSSEAIEIGSIEKTAAAYIELIRSIRPTGPYLLAGYSFGGLVAYEMAKQLVAAGESVPYLALFDTLNPVAPIRSYSITERVAVRWRSQNGMPLLGKVKTLAERFANGVETSRRIKAEVAAAGRALPADAHSELRAVQLREAHHEAMKIYQPSFYAGKMTLFRADAVNDKFEVPSDYGWSHLVRELEILDVPGEHLTLFDKENAPALARAFAKGLH
jgi:thioesterase domain-containing protein/acyl carrier protein